jgi:hypothetical protein
MSQRYLESEIEALKAGFCEEMIDHKATKAELEAAKKFITALVIRRKGFYLRFRTIAFKKV